MFYKIWDALCNLLPFVQIKVTLHDECFSYYLNCKNGIKSGKASHLLWALPYYFLSLALNHIATLHIY